jgi:hypothetical protein
VTRSREYERHCERLRSEAPLPGPERLRPWAVYAVKVLSFLWWAVVLVLMSGTFGRGW